VLSLDDTFHKVVGLVFNNRLSIAIDPSEDRVALQRANLVVRCRKEAGESNSHFAPRQSRKSGGNALMLSGSVSWQAPIWQRLSFTLANVHDLRHLLPPGHLLQLADRALRQLTRLGCLRSGFIRNHCVVDNVGIHASALESAEGLQVRQVGVRVGHTHEQRLEAAIIRAGVEKEQLLHCTTKSFKAKEAFQALRNAADETIGSNTKMGCCRGEESVGLKAGDAGGVGVEEKSEGIADVDAAQGVANEGNLGEGRVLGDD